jgi:hypothetical protein
MDQSTNMLNSQASPNKVMFRQYMLNQLKLNLLEAAGSVSLTIGGCRGTIPASVASYCN